MAAVAHDNPGRGDLARGVLRRRPAAGPGLGAGLLLAVGSAAAFGTAGAVGRGLLDAGWSPGAATLARVGLGAGVVLPLGLRALQGRWWLLRRHAGVVLLYGLLAVVLAQFCYFSAVQHMQVGPALMVEYTAPVAVVAWMWLRHGERPAGRTAAGAVVAGVGLLLVLDLLSGASVSPVGVAWALAAMVGLASYFVISADDQADEGPDGALPGMVLASGGLVVGTVVVAALGLVGLMPMTATTADAEYASATVPFWMPMLALGAVSAATAYVTGIAASRRLGSRLASFVALLEVLFAVLFSWALLGELPAVAQAVGGVLVLTGVVVVRSGERRVTRRMDRQAPAPSPGA